MSKRTSRRTPTHRKTSGLTTYRAKRDFGKTAEPRGKAARGKGFRYVIQKHAARRLHYDLRLELDRVMKSWAITRGPSLVPGDKRLAVEVEDHPIEYNDFEGIIPHGEYGGGTVMIWDRGTWTPDGDPHKGLGKGHLEFSLQGEKLKGRWHLVRMQRKNRESKTPWLLIKSDDEHARTPDDPDILERKSKSVASGRSMERIAADKEKVWHSKPVEEAGTPKPGHGVKTGNYVKGRKIRSAALRASPPDMRKTPPLGTTPRAAALPGFVPPSLATLVSGPPSGGGWLHEIKFDGYRMQMRIAGARITLKTRTGLDWTDRFSAIAEAGATLSDRDAILDGEIVSVDDDGLADFAALQDDLKAGRQDRLVYFAFDVLHLDGRDIASLPLSERQAALADLLDALPEGGAIRRSEPFHVDGAAMLEQACRLGIEGVVSKRADAPYRSGRHRDWLKSKCSNSQEFVIAGYEPSDKTGRAIRSLLLGYYRNGALHYAGRVGTGWGAAAERRLVAKLKDVERKTPPFDPVPEAERGRAVVWLNPKLVAEIDFRGWTGGTLLRQASFKGLREDKAARDVMREVATMPRETVKSTSASNKSRSKQTAARRAVKRVASKAAGPVQAQGVTLTHPERVYWKDAGVSKQDLAAHYAAVWRLMEPHVAGRVLAIVRCPEGHTGECFFQKHAANGLDRERLKLVKEPNGKTSIAVKDLEGLISLVQFGALEIHVRGSRIDDLERADRLVFDFDPGPGVEWKEIATAAREARDFLTDLKLESFLKTTGGKGLHVVVPVAPVPWDEAKAFARSFAEAMAATAPDRYTTTIRKSARKGRLFIDYLRNSREATAIAPWSTRARDGATVAVPIDWSELGRLKSSNPFTVTNLSARLKRTKADPWQAMLRLKQKLPKIDG